MANQRLVLKFGGSSLASPEQIRTVATKVAQLYHAGAEIIMVVSAMGKTTDSLTELAHQVSPNPSRRELDMLISTGERVSMALMAMALQDQKCPSISFTGSQGGIMTDGDYSGAKIIDIRPLRIEEALKDKKIVVIAGFQGVNPETKEITTLGRGGSDTTAVAMAAHFHADRCEILKDVDGIYSCDPKIAADARLYEKLPINIALEMCFWGAKVLNYRSVELAARKKVNLFVGRSDNFKIGTELVINTKEENNMFEQFEVAGVTSHKEVHHIHITCTDTAEAYTSFGNILRERGLPYPQVLASAYDNGQCRIMYTGDQAHLQSIRHCLEHSAKIKMGKVLSSVTLTCFGGVNTTIIEKSLEQLQAENIQPEKIITSALSISYFVDPSVKEKTLNVLSRSASK